MKKSSVFLIIFTLVSAAAFSNPVIMGKHKDMTKEDKKVDCSYCHFTVNKIAQKKGQIKDGKLDGKKYSQIKGCDGKDCHK